MADRYGRKPRPQRTQRTQRPANRDRDPVETAELGDQHWDDVVDVVCAGSAVATAAALAAVRLGLRVRLAASSDSVDEDTATYLSSVTDDLADPSPEGVGPELPVRQVDGPAGQPDQNPSGAVTFMGASLRTWAAKCVTAPGGVLSTSVADPRMTTRYTGFGRVTEVVPVCEVTAGADLPPFEQWLDDQADDEDVPTTSEDTLAGLVFDDGRVTGAVLDTPDGLRTVRARYGVVLALNDGADLTWPSAGVPDGATVDLAFVTMAASRFARLELLVTED